MSTTYPSVKQTFTDPSGTSPLSTGPDHAQLHTNINDTVEALQDTIGTTAGTNVLKYFSAGQFPARINAGGTIIQTLIGGTINNTTIGTSQITGGTINTAVLGTPTITLGSDAQGDIFYRSSGGTINRLAIGSNNKYLTTNGTTPSWASLPVSVSDEDNSGGSSTSSSTFANITGADVSVTTTTTCNILLTATISAYAATAAPYGIQFHDGTSNIGVEIRGDLQASNQRLPITIHTIAANKAAGTYTYTVQHRSQNNSTSCTAEAINVTAIAIPA